MLARQLLGDGLPLFPSQYVATLTSSWGLPTSELSTVFPNIGNFNKSDLGLLLWVDDPILGERQIAVPRATNTVPETFTFPERGA